VAGHRGNDGRITVRVAAGDASLWTEITEVGLGTPGREADGKTYTIEKTHGYRDRLVLKLEGIDDANVAAGLRGQSVYRVGDQQPSLPAGRWLAADLVGLTVEDERRGRIGRVRDLLPTGGIDLLSVQRDDSTDDDEDILIPMAEEILIEISCESGTIRVRLPEGLTELNRPTSG